LNGAVFGKKLLQVALLEIEGDVSYHYSAFFVSVVLFLQTLVILESGLLLLLELFFRYFRHFSLLLLMS